MKWLAQLKIQERGRAVALKEAAAAAAAAAAVGGEQKKISSRKLVLHTRSRLMR